MEYVLCSACSSHISTIYDAQHHFSSCPPLQITYFFNKDLRCSFDPISITLFPSSHILDYISLSEFSAIAYCPNVMFELLLSISNCSSKRPHDNNILYVHESPDVCLVYTEHGWDYLDSILAIDILFDEKKDEIKQLFAISNNPVYSSVLDNIKDPAIVADIKVKMFDVLNTCSNNVSNTIQYNVACAEYFAKVSSKSKSKSIRKH